MTLFISPWMTLVAAEKFANIHATIDIPPVAMTSIESRDVRQYDATTIATKTAGLEETTVKEANEKDSHHGDGLTNRHETFVFGKNDPLVLDDIDRTKMSDFEFYSKWKRWSGDVDDGFEPKPLGDYYVEEKNYRPENPPHPVVLHSEEYGNNFFVLDYDLWEIIDYFSGSVYIDYNCSFVAYKRHIWPPLDHYVYRR